MTRSLSTTIRNVDGTPKSGVKVTAALVDASTRQPIVNFESASPFAGVMGSLYDTGTTDDSGRVSLTVTPTVLFRRQCLYEVKIDSFLDTASRDWRAGDTVYISMPDRDIEIGEAVPVTEPTQVPKAGQARGDLWFSSGTLANEVVQDGVAIPGRWQIESGAPTGATPTTMPLVPPDANTDGIWVIASVNGAEVYATKIPWQGGERTIHLPASQSIKVDWDNTYLTLSGAGTAIPVNTVVSVYASVILGPGAASESAAADFGRMQTLSVDGNPDAIALPVNYGRFDYVHVDILQSAETRERTLSVALLEETATATYRVGGSTDVVWDRASRTLTKNEGTWVEVAIWSIGGGGDTRTVITPDTDYNSLVNKPDIPSDSDIDSRATVVANARISTHAGDHDAHGPIQDPDIPASIARDAEVDAKIGTHAADHDAHGDIVDSDLPSSIARESSVDSKIEAHRASHSAHGNILNQDIPDEIARDSEVDAKIATHAADHDAHGDLEDADIPAGIARDTEVAARIASHAGDHGAHGPIQDSDIPSGIARDSEVSSQIAGVNSSVDSKIAAHQGNHNAHGPLQVGDLPSEAATDAEVDAKIATHSADHDAHGDLVDADIPDGIARDSEVDSKLSNHAANHTAHGDLVEVDIPDEIARDAEVDQKVAVAVNTHRTDHDAHGDLVDADIPDEIARDAEVDSKIAAHAADSDAHRPLPDIPAGIPDAPANEAEVERYLLERPATNGDSTWHKHEDSDHDALTEAEGTALVRREVDDTYLAGNADPFPDSKIPANIARDSEVTAAVSAHAGDHDAHGDIVDADIPTTIARDSEVDAKISTHTADHDAHGPIEDSDIPAGIARDSEVQALIQSHAGDHDAHGDLEDSDIPAGIARDSEVDAKISTHANDHDAHGDLTHDDIPVEIARVTTVDSKIATHAGDHDAHGELTVADMPDEMATDQEVLDAINEHILTSQHGGGGQTGGFDQQARDAAAAAQRTANEVQSGLATEVTNRQSADNSLSTRIDGKQDRLTDAQIGDKAFSNPPNDLTNDEKLAARNAIGAGTGTGGGDVTAQQLQNEADARTAADNALGIRIDGKQDSLTASQQLGLLNIAVSSPSHYTGKTSAQFGRTVSIDIDNLEVITDEIHLAIRVGGETLRTRARLDPLTDLSISLTPNATQAASILTNNADTDRIPVEFTFTDASNAALDTYFEFIPIVEITEQRVLQTDRASADTVGKLAITPDARAFTTREVEHLATPNSFTPANYNADGSDTAFQGVFEATPAPAGYDVGDWIVNRFTFHPRIIVQRGTTKGWVDTDWASVGGGLTFIGAFPTGSQAEVAPHASANGQVYLDVDDEILRQVTAFVAGSTAQPTEYDKKVLANEDDIAHLQSEINAIDESGSAEVAAIRDNPILVLAQGEFYGGNDEDVIGTYHLSVQTQENSFPTANVAQVWIEGTRLLSDTFVPTDRQQTFQFEINAQAADNLFSNNNLTIGSVLPIALRLVAPGGTLVKLATLDVPIVAKPTGGTTVSGLTQPQVDARIAPYARATPSGTMAEAQVPPEIARDSEVDSKIATHNSAGDAHSDIRTALNGKQNTLTDVQIGDKAFSNPPTDLSDNEKLAARNAIGAGTGTGGGSARSFGTGAEDINPIARGNNTARWPESKVFSPSRLIDLLQFDVVPGVVLGYTTAGQAADWLTDWRIWVSGGDTVGDVWMEMQAEGQSLLAAPAPTAPGASLHRHKLTATNIYNYTLANSQRDNLLTGRTTRRQGRDIEIDLRFYDAASGGNVIDAKTIAVDWLPAPTAAPAPSTAAFGTSLIGTADFELGTTNYIFKQGSAAITIPATGTWGIINFGRPRADLEKQGEYFWVNFDDIRALTPASDGDLYSTSTRLEFGDVTDARDLWIGRTSTNRLLIAGAVSSTSGGYPDAIGVSLHAVATTNTALTDPQIGDKAFSNPPSDLTTQEQTAVRNAIGAGTGGGSSVSPSSATPTRIRRGQVGSAGDQSAYARGNHSHGADAITEPEIPATIARQTAVDAKADTSALNAVRATAEAATTPAEATTIADARARARFTDDEKSRLSRVWHHRGGWAANTAYAVGDVVTYDGHLYYVKVAVPSTNTAAPVDGATWELLSADPTPTATTTRQGTVEIATQTEMNNGSNRHTPNAAVVKAFVEAMLTPTVQTLTSAATITMAFGSGEIGDVTLAHNTTFNITGGSDGHIAQLRVTQDSTGGRTLALNAAVPVLTGVDAPAIKSAARATTILTFQRFGTQWRYMGQV